MKQLRILLACVAALLAVAAGTASSALAVAPGWLVGTSRLATGETKTEESRNVSGNVAKLIGEGTTVECTSVSDEGNIKGATATPGTDESTITFSGCSVAGKTEAECHVSGKEEPVGTITVAAKTELVYVGTKGEAEKEEGPIGDLFTPAAGTTFVTLNLEGSNCKTSGLVKVTGSVVAKTSPAPGLIAEWTRAIFPNPSVKKAYQWESAGKVKEIKPKLKAFGISENTQVGEEEIRLNEMAGLEFGVLDK